MREALVLVGEEGLEPMWARHLARHNDLWEGLREMGLEPFVEDPDARLVTVNTIKARRHCHPPCSVPSAQRGLLCCPCFFPLSAQPLLVDARACCAMRFADALTAHAHAPGS